MTRLTNRILELRSDREYRAMSDVPVSVTVIYRSRREARHLEALKALAPDAEVCQAHEHAVPGVMAELKWPPLPCVIVRRHGVTELCCDVPPSAATLRALLDLSESA